MSGAMHQLMDRADKLFCGRGGMSCHNYYCIFPIAIREAVKEITTSICLYLVAPTPVREWLDMTGKCFTTQSTTPSTDMKQNINNDNKVDNYKKYSQNILTDALRSGNQEVSHDHNLPIPQSISSVATWCKGFSCSWIFLRSVSMHRSCLTQTQQVVFTNVQMPPCVAIKYSEASGFEQ